MLLAFHPACSCVMRIEPPQLDIPCLAPNRMRTSSAGQEMLVPLTQSLYVPGELADTDHVLVDIGDRLLC